MKGSKFVEAFGLDCVVKDTWDGTGTDTTQLKADQHICLINSAAGAGTVFLPPIADCPPLSFYFVQSVTGHSGNVVVQPFQGGQATDDAIMRNNEPNGVTGGSVAATLTISAAQGWVLLMNATTCWIIVGEDLDAA
jgi:hypothetical protein